MPASSIITLRENESEIVFVPWSEDHSRDKNIAILIVSNMYDEVMS